MSELEFKDFVTLYAAILSSIVFAWNIYNVVVERKAKLNCWLRSLIGNGQISGPDIYYFFTNLGKREIVITHVCGKNFKENVPNFFSILPFKLLRFFRLEHLLFDHFIVNEEKLPFTLKPSHQFHSKLDLVDAQNKGKVLDRFTLFYVCDTHGKDWYAPKHSWKTIKKSYQDIQNKKNKVLKSAT